MTRAIPTELQAELEDRARDTFNKELALTALRLRVDRDFIMHAIDQLDVISIERSGQVEVLKRVGEALETWHPRTALDLIEEHIRSLRLQAAFAKQLAAYVQADIDQAVRDRESAATTRGSDPSAASAPHNRSTLPRTRGDLPWREIAQCDGPGSASHAQGSTRACSMFRHRKSLHGRRSVGLRQHQQATSNGGVVRR